MNDFLHMGGYAIFVWSAYSISAAALIVLVLHARTKAKRMGAQVDAMRRNRKETS